MTATRPADPVGVRGSARAGVARLHRADPGHVPFEAAELELPLVARFWRQVCSAPDRPAVLGGRRLSYAELGGSAAAIAAALRRVPPGTAGANGRRVALLLPHGPETIAAILGTLSAGAAYVPLDPTYPPRRLARMLKHAAADLVLTVPAHRGLAEELAEAAGTGARLLDADGLGHGDPAALDPEAEAEAAAAVQPGGPAYILYTSGSTGRPKGVAQSHRNALHQVRTHTDNLGIGPGDRLSVLSSFSFDMAVTDTLAALLNGAATVPVDVRTAGLGGLWDALVAAGVTVYHSTPTVYRSLLDALDALDGRNGPGGTGPPAGAGPTLPSVRAVVLGGEAVIRDDLDRYRRHFAEHCVFVNGYGATEISFAVQTPLTMADVHAGRGTGDGVVPIGQPLDGAEVILLDQEGRPAARGEIAVRSPYLASYWRAEKADAARFTAAPDGVRTYRTGDLGRRLPDGGIVYLGRLDRQVKVRGHRVELGEVEAALAGLPEVARAAAVARAARAGDRVERAIVAYVVPAGQDPVEPDELRRRLGELLPSFMLPSAIVPLAALPLTPTGKIDARALPDPEAPAAAGPADPPGREGRGPAPGGQRADQRADRRADVGRAIADAWCAVLGLSEVEPDRNFFDLGGDSLRMAQIQQRLEGSLAVRLPLTTLFAHPTVASLTDHLAADGGSTATDRHGDAAQRAARRGARARAVARSRAAGSAGRRIADLEP